MRPATVAILGILAILSGCFLPPASKPELSIEPEEGEAPLTQITNGRAGEDKDPEISKDGSLLFWASSSYGENLDLYVKKIGTNTVTRLTQAPSDERFPKVNPSNKRSLAFASNNRGEWDIYVIEDYIDNPSKVVLVSEPGTQDIHPSWSPDGQYLVYCSTEDFGSGIWMLKIRDLMTGKTQILEDIDGLLPEWSPKGNRIVFQRMKHRDGWYSSIWTLEYTLGTVSQLTAIFAHDDWAAINPSWSPDGRKVVFATVGKSRARAQVLNEADDIWTVNADGSHPTRLTTASAADWMPTWVADPESRDGRIYFVSKRTGTNRIWSMVPKLPEPGGSEERATPGEGGGKTALGSKD